MLLRVGGAVFMNLFVVSLVRAADRRARFARNDLQGISYSFFDAVDALAGEHVSVSRYNEEKALRTFGAPLRSGEIACFASHYQLWERCRDEGIALAIMEDDVIVAPLFREALRLAGELVRTHRFIRLAGQKQRPFRPIRRLAPPFQLVSFLSGPEGLQCYCISPDGAKALLAGAREWIQPVDLYIDSAWKHGLAPKAIVPFQAEEIDRGIVPSMIGDRQHRRTGLRKVQREVSRLRDKLAMKLFMLVQGRPDRKLQD
jgi:glycosyl transferase, family 25